MEIKIKKHRCNFKITEYSNVIQYDTMGYPLRLCIEKCDCGKSRQAWIDTCTLKNDVETKWYSTRYVGDVNEERMEYKD